MTTSSRNLQRIFDRDNMHIYPWYISELVTTKEIGNIAQGKVLKESFVVITKDFLEMYYDIPSMTAVGQSFLTQVLENRSFYGEVVRQLKSHSRQLLAFCENAASQDLAKVSNQELADLYSQYVRHLRAMRVWGWVMPFLDGLTEHVSFTDVILAKLRAQLETQGKADKVAEFYSTLSSSEKKSEVQKEEIARLKLLAQLLTDKDAETVMADIKANLHQNFAEKYPRAGKRIGKHLKKFGWLTYAYEGPPMQIEHLFALLKDNLKRGDVEEQLQKIENHYKTIRQEKRRLIKELKLPQELVYLLKASSEFMFIKDYRKGVYQKSYLLMDTVLEEIGKRLMLSLKEVKFMVEPEIRAALIDKVDHSGKTKQRLQKCCFHIENGVIRVWEGAECEQKIKELVGAPKAAEDVSSLTELKGMPAYTGKVTGTAKVVLVASDVAKVNEGDILISSATNPDLVLAMKRAAAFVTDTGGIISHAAIVSREMKKPCIVGTRQATRVFKDGDTIEVDADKGLVKLLQRNQ